MLNFRPKEDYMKTMKKMIMILLVAIMAISGTMIIKKNLRLKQEAQDFAAIQAAMSETETVPETQPEPAKEEKDEDEPTELAYEPSEQLIALMEQYPDCIGYISIEGTKISYPIMQNEDNEYYLHRDMEGKKSVGGCIYMDSNHDIHEKGLHVVYGHHMKNGSMFRDVARFTDATYFAEHQNITIQASDKELRLRPVYCYAGKADGTYRNVLENHGQVIDFIKSHTGLDVDADDLYVLVTCSYGSQDERTYLYCVPEQ